MTNIDLMEMLTTNAFPSKIEYYDEFRLKWTFSGHSPKFLPIRNGPQDRLIQFLRKFHGTLGYHYVKKQVYLTGRGHTVTVSLETVLDDAEQAVNRLLESMVDVSRFDAIPLR